MSGPTTLRRTKVFARRRGTRAAAARLLNAEGAALDHLTLETFLGSVGLLTSGHVDETEATRLLGVGVHHDGAVLDVAILLEKARNIGLGQTRVDTSHEQVGTSVLGALLIFFLRGQMGLAQGTRTAEPRLAKDDSVGVLLVDLPVLSPAVGGTAASTVASRLIARGGATVAVVPGLIWRKTHRLVRRRTRRGDEETYQRNRRCRCRSQP